MADIKKLKSKIVSTIYPNGIGAINAADHQVLLLDMATAISDTGEEITEQVTEMLDTKIDKTADDYYPQLSVGTADNLSGVDEVDSEFSFRRSGGGAIADGVARVQSIKGNSVVWNQRAVVQGMKGSYDNSEGEGTSYQITGLFVNYTTAINGHKIYAHVIDRENKIPYFYFTDNIQLNLLGGVFFTANIAVTELTNIVAGIPAGVNASWDIDCIFVDLTQMYGAGNEPTTIEEFNARKPIVEDEYAYNEGEVIHMTAEGIISKGVNAWDEEWMNGYIYEGTVYENSAMGIISKNHIRVLPDTQYSCTIGSAMSYATMSYYDKEKKYIGQQTLGNARTFKTPANCRYILFFVEGMPTYNHDICIGISGDWNGYHAPIEASEDLSIVAKYFPNGMRSAGSAHDEIRYNKSTNRWEKVVRIGEVDMSSLNWGTGFGGIITSDLQSRMRKPSKVNEDYVLCSIIPTNGEGKNISIIYGGEDYDYNGWLKVLGYNSLEDFLAEIQGAKLYYELAEPIVTEIEEKDFNLDYKVWNCGTEQMVASKPSSALSADITYGFNAVGLIKQLRSMIEALSAKVANL